MRNYNFVCRVRSKSNPNKYYTVKMTEEGQLTCNCPSWIYNQRRNRTCKHIDEIRRAGFSVDKTGRFLTIDEGWKKSPFYCEGYPDKCDECDLRFHCWVEEIPEFRVSEMREAGLL